MRLKPEQVKQALGLNLRQILTMAGFSFLLLFVVNISVITLHFTQGTLLAKEDVQSSFAQQIQEWLSLPIFNTITLIVFWIAVGLLAYSILYWVYNVFSEARNEVIVERDYVNHQSKEEKKKWPVIELGLFAGLIVLALLTLGMLFPIWNSWFISFIFSVPGDLLVGSLYLLGSIAGMFATIYAFKFVVGLMLILE